MENVYLDLLNLDLEDEVVETPLEARILKHIEAGMTPREAVFREVKQFGLKTQRLIDKLEREFR